jgi:hypothetical protein
MKQRLFIKVWRWVGRADYGRSPDRSEADGRDAPTGDHGTLLTGLCDNSVRAENRDHPPCPPSPNANVPARAAAAATVTSIQQAGRGGAGALHAPKKTRSTAALPGVGGRRAVAVPLLPCPVAVVIIWLSQCARPVPRNRMPGTGNEPTHNAGGTVSFPFS